jgi:mono/diheme cytochrome c family protein
MMSHLPLSRILIVGQLLLILLFFSGCGAPPGNPADGKRWFMMNNCSSCHGIHGNDGRAVHIANIKMSFGSFVRKLRTTDAPIMPYFPESKVSKQDAADIYAYLKSITPESTR